MTTQPAKPTLPRQMAITRRFRLGLPHSFSISADGDAVYFLRSRGGTDPVSCLWAMDCQTWAERLLADPIALLGGASEQLSEQERTRRERSRELSSGIVSYAASDSGAVLVFPLSGQLWVLRGGGTAGATAGQRARARPAPGAWRQADRLRQRGRAAGHRGRWKLRPRRRGP